MNSMNYSTENYCKEENNLLFEENVASFSTVFEKVHAICEYRSGSPADPKNPEFNNPDNPKFYKI